MQSLSELTGNQIADEFDTGKEDDEDDVDASKDGIITCKASASLELTLYRVTHLVGKKNILLTRMWEVLPSYLGMAAGSHSNSPTAARTV